VVSYVKGGTQTKVFENKISKRIFVPKRYESGEWRKLRN